MTFKHTPGPWGVIHAPKQIVILGGGAPGRHAVAICALGSSAGVRTEANALLIAAAPDLLAELKSMTLLLRSALLCTSVEIAKEARPLLDKADAVITRATGA